MSPAHDDVVKRWSNSAHQRHGDNQTLHTVDPEQKSVVSSCMTAPVKVNIGTSPSAMVAAPDHTPLKS